MNEDIVRQELIKGLLGEDAHFSFEEATKDFPMERINERPPNSDYTPWRLLEHIRGTQADMLEYISSDNYKEKNWPEDYWPNPKIKATPKMWKGTIKNFRRDLKKLVNIAKDAKCSLTARLPQNSKHTLFRQIRILINHNSYHIGEFAILRQVMKTW